MKGGLPSTSRTSGQPWRDRSVHLPAGRVPVRQRYVTRRTTNESGLCEVRMLTLSTDRLRDAVVQNLHKVRFTNIANEDIFGL